MGSIWSGSYNWQSRSGTTVTKTDSVIVLNLGPSAVSGGIIPFPATSGGKNSSGFSSPSFLAAHLPYHLFTIMHGKINTNHCEKRRNDGHTNMG
jgi:hypothetical protein